MKLLPIQHYEHGCINCSYFWMCLDTILKLSIQLANVNKEEIRYKVKVRYQDVILAEGISKGISKIDNDIVRIDIECEDFVRSVGVLYGEELSVFGNLDIELFDIDGHRLKADFVSLGMEE